MVHKFINDKNNRVIIQSNPFGFGIYSVIFVIYEFMYPLHCHLKMGSRIVV